MSYASGLIPGGADAYMERMTARDVASFPAPFDVLTLSEYINLELASRGLGTKETGQIVPVAEGTVRNQRSFILEKTGSRSIAHTVFRASELDLFGERLEESLSPPVLRFPESYKEHLGFIAFGFSGEEVEALLGLTRSARRRRVERMRHLLGARNIPHAVRIGAERELI